MCIFALTYRCVCVEHTYLQHERFGATSSTVIAIFKMHFSCKYPSAHKHTHTPSLKCLYFLYIPQTCYMRDVSECVWVWPRMNLVHRFHLGLGQTLFKRARKQLIFPTNSLDCAQRSVRCYMSFFFFFVSVFCCCCCWCKCYFPQPKYTLHFAPRLHMRRNA